ncbi:MAG TPA: hypothetical protein GXX36_03975 [Clostridiaceae bacterium]|nr:hypothetical protein [Clostridiaceae bacterium]
MKKDKGTYAVLKNASLPTEQQKEKMLAHILSEYRIYKSSPAEKLYRLIAAYPWRFALGLSTVQAVLCTMIWGREYTNLVLKILGG